MQPHPTKNSLFPAGWCLATHWKKMLTKMMSRFLVCQSRRSRFLHVTALRVLKMLRDRPTNCHCWYSFDRYYSKNTLFLNFLDQWSHTNRTSAGIWRGKMGKGGARNGVISKQWLLNGMSSGMLLCIMFQNQKQNLFSKWLKQHDQMMPKVVLCLLH